MSLFSHAAFMITKAGQVRVQVATLTLTNHHTGNGAKAYDSCQSVREIQQATMLVGWMIAIDVSLYLYRLQCLQAKCAQYE